MLCQDQEDEAREGRDLAGREAPDQEAGDLAAPGAIMAGRDFTGLPRRPRRAGPTGISAGEDAAVSPLSSPSWALWGRFLLSSCNPGETLPLLHSTTKRGGPLGSPLFVL